MGTSNLHVRRIGRHRSTLTRVIACLTTSSLLLYLAVTCTQRVWVLLNSDVGQLLRRL
jgi:hypothetical protein